LIFILEFQIIFSVKSIFPYVFLNFKSFFPSNQFFIFKTEIDLTEFFVQSKIGWMVGNNFYFCSINDSGFTLLITFQIVSSRPERTNKIGKKNCTRGFVSTMMKSIFILLQSGSKHGASFSIATVNHGIAKKRDSNPTANKTRAI